MSCSITHFHYDKINAISIRTYVPDEGIAVVVATLSDGAGDPLCKTNGEELSLPVGTYTCNNSDSTLLNAQLVVA